MKLYRYRPYEIKDGHNYDKTGLEKSELYFQDLSKLNDPMEGYKDIYFLGDKVIWRNFFRNYVRSLNELCLTLYFEPDKNIIPHDIILYQYNSEYFESICKFPVFIKIPQYFLKESTIQKLINCLENTVVTQEQLLLCLKTVHLLAIKALFSCLYDEKLISQIPELLLKQSDKLSPINWDIILGKDNSRQRRMLSSITNSLFKSVELFNIPNSKGQKYIFLDFPQLFLKRIEYLMYPEFYVTCFSETPTNSSMWGHYANNHQGICLIFDFNPSINLYTPKGYDSNGTIMGYTSYTPNKISYDDKLISLNFFDNIGNITVPLANRFWYIDEDTKEISTVQRINDKNRKMYWDNVYNSLSRKTKDWAYEQEQRILLNNMFGDFQEEEKRNIKYDFNALEGIIFGIKTTDTDKREILDILHKKCIENKRTDLKIYQAYYNRDIGEISYQQDIWLTNFLKQGI